MGIPVSSSPFRVERQSQDQTKLHGISRNRSPNPTLAVNHFSSRSSPFPRLEAGAVCSLVGSVDATVVLNDLGLELLPVLGEVGWLLWCGLLAPGLLNTVARGGNSRSAGRVGARGARRVVCSVGSVHLVVVVLDGGPQLVGVGLGLGSFNHAGDDRVVAARLQ